MIALNCDMWVTKFKINKEGMLFGDNVSKSNCNIFGYPISYYKKNNKIAVIFSAQILGTEDNIRNFLRLLKQDKRTINIERNKDFVIFEVFQHPSSELLFHDGVICVNPIIINSNGDSIVELGCFNKEPLTKIIKSMDQFNIKLYYIKQSKINNISLMTVMPNLTDKQKLALELAIKNDYYEYPRKIELKKLAKLMNVSYATYHFHLRKAEKKIMSFSYDKLK